MFVCFFIVCVFLPRSLLPFGKNLDSKRTIYFEWPKYKYLTILTNNPANLVNTQCFVVKSEPLWIP